MSNDGRADFTLGEDVQGRIFNATSIFRSADLNSDRNPNEARGDRREGCCCHHGQSFEDRWRRNGRCSDWQWAERRIPWAKQSVVLQRR
jgi:hypothetical protein